MMLVTSSTISVILDTVGWPSLWWPLLFDPLVDVFNTFYEQSLSHVQYRRYLSEICPSKRNSCHAIIFRSSFTQWSCVSFVIIFFRIITALDKTLRAKQNIQNLKNTHTPTHKRIFNKGYNNKELTEPRLWCHVLELNPIIQTHVPEYSIV